MQKLLILDPQLRKFNNYDSIRLHGGFKTIDSYDFGRIVIDGHQYTTDVIVFPDRVIGGWWRREGHRLHVEDLEKVLREKPEVLIVGTGYSGLMRVPNEVRDYVKTMGIELIAQSTREACETFNRLIQSKRAVAALHLTC